MAILATQRVLTLDYWKLAKDLVPGDYVFNNEGNPVKIKLVQEYRSEECYEVTFDDYLTVAGDKYLAFPVEDRDCRNQSDAYKGHFKFKKLVVTKTCEELFELPMVDRRNRKTFSIKTTKPLNLPYQTLPVPSFIFGYWFFARNKPGTMSPPEHYAQYVHQQFKDHGYQVILKSRRNIPRKPFVSSPTVLSHLVPLVPTKIPNNYLLGSFEQRLALLSGILHSKSRQYNKKHGFFNFQTKNKHYASQIQFLAESLGCKTRSHYNEQRDYYSIKIITRLKLTQDQEPKRFVLFQARRYLVTVRKIAPQLCIHLETEGKNNTILVGEGFIATC